VPLEMSTVRPTVSLIILALIRVLYKDVLVTALLGLSVVECEVSSVVA
jgi:hypothetical protein